MSALAWWSALAFAVLVASLARISARGNPPRAWDQWHHGWLLLAALPLPEWARWVCLAVGADDALNHLLEATVGWREMSPLAVLYRLGCRLVGVSG